HQRALGDDLQVRLVGYLVLHVGDGVSRGDVELAVVLPLGGVGAAEDGVDGDVQALGGEQPLVLRDVQAGLVGDGHGSDRDLRRLCTDTRAINTAGKYRIPR